LGAATVALVGVAAMVAPASPARATDSTWPVTGSRLTTVRVVETLGDSVPSGSRCGCRPFPALVAARLAAITGPPVVSYNDARGGHVAADVLAVLRGSANVRAHVRAAQVVVVEIGANDVQYSATCGTTASCYAARLPRVRQTLLQIVATIRSLAAGHRVAVLLLGYWNVWLDGRYAAARGAAYVKASDSVTWSTNATIRGVAQRTGSAYADLWLAFRGTTARDDTALLASDGDHPDAAGHAVIAAAALRVLRTSLSRIPYPPVSPAHLRVGARNGDVTTYQEALREFLVRTRRLGSLDPTGITGSYGAVTEAMTRAAYADEAHLTGDPSWLSGDLSVPGPELLQVLGLRLT
ncbi:MAG: SGNH/GDSL hydrolase family protein, partial [Actinomycetales bacterium]|nr:SGNH/GDSL hydrolase family protein [Actinomycetales bacterium]